MDLKVLLFQEWGLQPTQISPIEEGLINHTWLVRTTTSNFILQKINAHVFKEPAHLQQQLQGLSKAVILPKLIPLQFLPTKSGTTCLEFENQYYRLAAAITPSRTLTMVTTENSKLAAAALLEFHAALTRIDAQTWQAPISGFLDVGLRLQTYQDALRNTDSERRLKATEAIALLEQNWSSLTDWQLFLEKAPKVLIHADPKLSNFLFHPSGNQVRALIDWDTIQLGSPFYDYGDMLRSYCSLGEDVPEGKPLFREEIFEALLESLQLDEVKIFTAACGVILVQALRFLTDYLQYDVYYKIKDEQHNLRRAFNQLRLAEELKAYWFTTRKPIR
jgi:aminoglycoside phosphotransferase (APT) family kinase protein